MEHEWSDSAVWVAYLISFRWGQASWTGAASGRGRERHLGRNNFVRKKKALEQVSCTSLSEIQAVAGQR